MLFDLLFFPITGPIRGVQWVIQRIKEQIDTELYSVESIRKRLVALNESLDNGQISEEEFADQEAVLLDMLERAEAENSEEINP